MMFEEIEYYESWIDKSVKDFESITKINELNSEFIYTEPKDFFGMPHVKGRLIRNSLNQISMVSLVFGELLNQNSFEKMVMHYGEPTIVGAKDKLIFQSKTKAYGEFGQSVSKREYSLKAVTFQENPIWIIWKKSYFQLSIRQDFRNKAIHVLYKKLILG